MNFRSQNADLRFEENNNQQTNKRKMRTLTDHKVNGLNEALAIAVMDEPGAGGANHAYEISWLADPSGHSQRTVRIGFQNGPIKEAGVNGISQEALLAIVIDRLRCFQAGPYRSNENEFALRHCESALSLLHARTKERLARGVEGTSRK